MTTAIIGTGGIGSAIARQLAGGGESVRLSGVDAASTGALANQIGPTAVVASDNNAVLDGADAVVLALRFVALQGVIGEIGGAVGDRVVVVPSNPVGPGPDGQITRLLPAEESSGAVVGGWLPPGAHLAMAFGTMSAELLESSSRRSPERAVLFYAAGDERAADAAKRLIRIAGFEPLTVGGVEASGRFEVGGQLHDLVVGADEAQSLLGAG